MDISALQIDTPVEIINQAILQSLVGNLGIEITKTAEGQVEAKMKVNAKTCRPDGMLHGGANLAMAETLAGLGSMLLVDLKEFDVLGIQVNGNHTGSVKNGTVKAIAKIIHQGNQTHIWNVDIISGEGKLISSARVTNMVVKRNG